MAMLTPLAATTGQQMRMCRRSAESAACIKQFGCRARPRGKQGRPPADLGPLSSGCWRNRRHQRRWPVSATWACSGAPAHSRGTALGFFKMAEFAESGDAQLLRATVHLHLFRAAVRLCDGDSAPMSADGPHRCKAPRTRELPVPRNEMDTLKTQDSLPIVPRR